jgi:hypothetical protein
MIVTNVGWDAVDAGPVVARFFCAGTSGEAGVRRSRVVLTPRCWRQVFARLTLLANDGVKKPVTGESTE